MDTFFLPYQIAWIKDRSRIKLMEKSRQIGMSWTTAYSLVRRHCRAGEKNDSWVSSRDELQAKLFIDDCKKFAGILNAASRECCGAETASDSDSRSLEFANGTRIWSLSSNPDAQAGKRGTRVLDEFALHPDPARLYAIAYPGITWGGSLEIISTHRGGENFFAKLVEEARYGGNPKRISLHRITLQDALEQGLLKKLKASLPPDHEVSQMDEAAYFDYIKNSCADEESFLQEYMCTPADDRAAFLSYDCVRRCLYKDGEAWREPFSPENPQYLGVDVGRTRDLTVFWLLEKCGDVLFTRDVRVFRDVPFSEQEVVLHSYLRNPYLRRAAVDMSGLGRQFAERAAEGDSCVSASDALRECNGQDSRRHGDSRRFACGKEGGFGRRHTFCRRAHCRRAFRQVLGVGACLARGAREFRRFGGLARVAQGLGFCVVGG